MYKKMLSTHINDNADDEYKKPYFEKRNGAKNKKTQRMEKRTFALSLCAFLMKFE